MQTCFHSPRTIRTQDPCILTPEDRRNRASTVIEVVKNGEIGRAWGDEKCIQSFIQDI